MLKKLKKNKKKRFYSGRADRCIGNPGNSCCIVDSGFDWVY